MWKHIHLRIFLIWFGPMQGSGFQRLHPAAFQRLRSWRGFQKLPFEMACIARSMLEETPKRSTNAPPTTVSNSWSTNALRQNEGGSKANSVSDERSSSSLHFRMLKPDATVAGPEKTITSPPHNSILKQVASTEGTSFAMVSVRHHSPSWSRAISFVAIDSLLHGQQR